MTSLDDASFQNHISIRLHTPVLPDVLSLNLSQRWNQLAGSVTLHDVSARTCRNCFRCEWGGVELAHHENQSRWEFMLNAAGSFEAVHYWHRYVQQHHVRTVLQRLTDGI